MSTPLAARPGTELLAEIRAGTVTPSQVVESAAAEHARWESGDRPLNAFLVTDFDRARARAAELDAAPHGALAGMPVALKDNLSTTDFATTCSSRILEGYTPPFDATVVRRLREAGAVVVGKTNLDEFAMGSSTENSAFGVTRNPLDLDRVPGGSSGGSAAAVAAGVVPFSLGSDTGGSIRQPAAFCGIAGIKPSYGRVSRYGLVAFASSLDQIGTFGRTVADATLLLEAISGHDPRDSTSATHAVPDLVGALGGGVEGLVIGVPEEYFPDSLDGRIRDLCRAALRKLEAAGAEIRPISLPHTAHAIPTYYIIAPAEASSNLARFDGVRYGARAAGARSLGELYERTRALFGTEVKRRIMLGTYVLSSGYYDAFYARAQKVRALIARDFEWAFRSGVDAIFTPTTPSPAFAIGAVSDPYEMYLSDVFTVTANLAGVPAMSLPIGTVDGLPVGGQVISRMWDEATMVRVARAVEEGVALP